MQQRTTIELLGFEGCPNTPILRQRLHEALPNGRIVEVDLRRLEPNDPRLGWGAPTILVNGIDLFGELPNQGGSLSCRNWSGGLPEVEELRSELGKRFQ